MPALDFTKKIAACVTGVPRGVGHTIVEELGKILTKGSKIVLITHKSNEAREATQKLKGAINRDVIVEAHIADFAAPNSALYKSIIDKMFMTIVKNQFEIAIIFHNAYTMGTMNTTTTLTDLAVWRKACDVNLISPALLNANFIVRAKSEVKTMFVVNLSQVFGHIARPYLAMNGSIYAARHMYFQTLVAEEPEITVLSYSPGLVKIPMMNAISNEKNNPQLKQMLARMWAEKKVVSAQETVHKLFKILEEGQFKSGDFIDYHNRHVQK